MYLTPFWTHQTPRPVELSGSELPGQVDVVVVGSGVTGLNAAIELSKVGVAVAVLEQEVIGWGASTRNAGMMSAGSTASTDYQLRKYGVEKTRQLFKWSAEAVNYVEKVIDEEQISCDFKRCGAVFLACNIKQFEGLRVYQQELEREYGFMGTSLLTPEQLQSEIGSSIYAGGLVNDFSAGLDPAKYIYGLAAAAAKYGSQLVEHARVRKIKRADTGYQLDTTLGLIKASEVLLATNGYTTNLVPRIRQGIFPAGSYIIVTEPLPPDLQQELAPTGRNFEDTRTFLNYFCLTPDGRVLIGGRRSLSTQLDLETSADHLYRRLIEIWPQVVGYEVTHAWTGKLGVSFDRMPHAGQLEGIWFANGFCGHGLANGSYLGYEMGQVIAGKRQSSLIMELETPRYFFASLDKLFIPPVSLFFRFMDWKENRN
ncbi:MAG: NAD(P)/FAD-dependent oxidoreductase [Anaerolineales bacterium]|jgi:glycine/D-amino acid oxidase-like deaminating enzyme